ncbi:MAG: hypothetical protein WC027_02035 [Candidatus Paceibacterota bacterium]
MKAFMKRGSLFITLVYVAVCTIGGSRLPKGFFRLYEFLGVGMSMLTCQILVALTIWILFGAWAVYSMTTPPKWLWGVRANFKRIVFWTCFYLSLPILLRWVNLQGTQRSAMVVIPLVALVYWVMRSLHPSNIEWGNDDDHLSAVQQVDCRLGVIEDGRDDELEGAGRDRV